MQSNKQITDTSKTTVKQAILDNQDNVNALRSSNSGTSFPSDPIAGMHCYRTDTKKMYMYDGSNWVEEVDVNNDQQISGAKTFTGKLEASTVNAANLSVSGAATVPTPNADNNSKTVATTAFVKTAIANLVGSAPSTLDTLHELSAVLGNDANFSATVASQIGKKLDKSGGTITGPILYGKTPNDNSELPNKAYVDSAIKSAVNAAVASVTKTLSANMHAQYPVGCYLYSDKANNPATYLPYMSDTTWVQTAAGRVLIGAGKADSGTVYNAGATGGKEKHKLTVKELPERVAVGFISHGTHKGYAISRFPNEVLQDKEWGYVNICDAKTYGLYDGDYAVPISIMPPYKAVYVWHRTA